MFVVRVLLTIGCLAFFVNSVTAQNYVAQPNRPYQQPVLQPQQYQQPTIQQDPRRQEPIRMQPLQTPPKSITHNGVPVYQAQPGQPQLGQNAQYADRTMPPGFGSPYPTGDVNVKVATTQGSVYGLPPQNPQNPQNPNGPQPQPGAAQPPVASNAAPMRPMVPAQPIGERVHMGRAEPQNRVIPFFLTPEEQRDLDEFLIRWEKSSDKINRYDVDFTSYVIDPTIPRANPNDDPNKPYKIGFGYFKFIKPNRFVHEVEGEWINGYKARRTDKNPNILAEKIIINEKSVFHYDYNAKTVYQFDIPPEKIGLGLADSPLPLIFGAKAEEMKKRFSMKIVTPDKDKDSQIWLHAKPLLVEDQQEFSQIVVQLDKKTLEAKAVKKDDTNGKSHTVYVLQNTKINDRLKNIFEDLKTWFIPTVPNGWKHVVHDMTGPDAVPETPQRHVAEQPNIPRNEIKLYTAPTN